MKKLIVLAAFVAPSVAFAQVITDFNSLTYKLTNINNVLVGLLVTVGVFFIIWNAVQFIIKADNPEERKAKGMAIIWGAIGLVAIFSIWGIVNFFINTFKTNNTQPAGLPTTAYPNRIP